jgi:hypothetical protein
MRTIASMVFIQTVVEGVRIGEEREMKGCEKRIKTRLMMEGGCVGFVKMRL